MWCRGERNPTDPVSASPSVSPSPTDPIASASISPSVSPEPTDPIAPPPRKPRPPDAEGLARIEGVRRQLAEKRDAYPWLDDFFSDVWDAAVRAKGKQRWRSTSEGQRVRAARPEADKARATQRKNTQDKLDRNITKHANAYRTRHKYRQGTHSTTALAKYVAKQKDIDVGYLTIKDRYFPRLGIK